MVVPAGGGGYLNKAQSKDKAGAKQALTLLEPLLPLISYLGILTVGKESLLIDRDYDGPFRGHEWAYSGLSDRHESDSQINGHNAPKLYHSRVAARNTRKLSETQYVLEGGDMDTRSEL